MTWLAGAAPWSVLAALLLAAAAQAAPPPGARIEVSGAWARATVTGQPASAVYFRVTADRDLELVGVRSSAARRCEMHETTQAGDVMRMRAVARVALKAGEPLVFEERHLHLMLLELAQPLRAGGHIELTLDFVDARAVHTAVRVDVPVRSSD